MSRNELEEVDGNRTAKMEKKQMEKQNEELVIE